MSLDTEIVIANARIKGSGLRIKKCGRCNGDGVVYDRIMLFCSFGLAPLIDKLMGFETDTFTHNVCPKCNGERITVEEE